MVTSTHATTITSEYDPDGNLVERWSYTTAHETGTYADPNFQATGVTFTANQSYQLKLTQLKLEAPVNQLGQNDGGWHRFSNRGWLFPSTDLFAGDTVNIYVTWQADASYTQAAKFTLYNDGTALSATATYNQQNARVAPVLEPVWLCHERFSVV